MHAVLSPLVHSSRSQATVGVKVEDGKNAEKEQER